jgi:hypothetical protein
MPSSSVIAPHRNRRVRRAFRMARLVLPAVLFFSGLQLQAQPSREYQLKAVLLLNLVRFVEWPATTFEATNSPIVIGVIGDPNPFGTFIDDVVRNEKVNGRSIVVEKYKSVNDLKKCHVLFVAAADKRAIEKVLPKVDKQPVLTVADEEGFVRAGGLVELFIKPTGKIGLRINADGAKTAKLALSAKLLRLAEIVTAESKPRADK